MVHQGPAPTGVGSVGRRVPALPVEGMGTPHPKACRGPPRRVFFSLEIRLSLSTVKSENVSTAILAGTVASTTNLPGIPIFSGTGNGSGALRARARCKQRLVEATVRTSRSGEAPSLAVHADLRIATADLAARDREPHRESPSLFTSLLSLSAIRR